MNPMRWVIVLASLANAKHALRKELAKKVVHKPTVDLYIDLIESLEQAYERDRVTGSTSPSA